MSERKTPVGHAVDLVVYAPIGLLSETRRLLPSFVDKGRAKVDMYKVVGRFAVQQGQVTAKKQFARSQEQVEEILSGFGIGPSGSTAVQDDGAATAADQVADPGTSKGAESAPAPRSSSAAAELPLADYDSLAASQVIPRLMGLDVEELEAVRAYEAAHRGRKTILGKLAQLQGS